MPLKCKYNAKTSKYPQKCDMCECRCLMKVISSPKGGVKPPKDMPLPNRCNASSKDHAYPSNGVAHHQMTHHMCNILHHHHDIIKGRGSMTSPTRCPIIIMLSLNVMHRVQHHEAVPMYINKSPMSSKGCMSSSMKYRRIIINVLQGPCHQQACAQGIK